jgi:hypothetical protein
MASEFLFKAATRGRLANMEIAFIINDLFIHSQCQEVGQTIRIVTGNNSLGILKKKKKHIRADC